MDLTAADAKDISNGTLNLFSILNRIFSAAQQHSKELIYCLPSPSENMTTVEYKVKIERIIIDLHAKGFKVSLNDEKYTGQYSVATLNISW